MLNTVMKNENKSFANISIFFPKSCSQALKQPLLKFQLKPLKQLITYDNIYTNQLKLKVKTSKVIMEGYF